MMETPEHDKVSKHKEEMQTIGEFLEWLNYHKHYIVCEYGKFDILHPVGMSENRIQELLAEFYGIDYKAYLAEKQAAYEFVSGMANQ